MAVVNDADLVYMKNILREDVMPMFSDAQLADMLQRADSLDEAIYKAAIQKSENTSLIVSGVTVADSSAYFLRIARTHRPNNTGTLKGE